MVRIETFVVIDLETTGLPHKENRVKITEMCLIAASRNDIRDTATGKLPSMSKLIYLLNTEKYTPHSPKTTGVKKTLSIKEIINPLNAFLAGLKKPVCLVAHNGNCFDFKILLTECIEARVSLPPDLLCVDSLSILKKIHKWTVPEDSFNSSGASTSDGLSKSLEKIPDIDDLCSAFSDHFNVSDLKKINKSPTKVSDGKTPPKKLNKSPAKVSDGKTPPKKPVSMKLSDIFIRYFGGMIGMTAHRAEDDCLMLLHLMVATKVAFCKLSDSSCKFLTDCKPIERTYPACTMRYYQETESESD